MRLLIAILVIAFGYAQTTNAEGEESSVQVGISTSIGIQPGGHNIPIRHNFPDATINTTIAYGCGLNVGNIDFLFSSTIGFAVEVAVIPLHADRVERSDGATAEYNGMGVPILLWSEVDQPGKFGPFVRFGVGTIHLEFSRRYDPLPWYDADFDFWSFAYGFGGGLRYLISEHLECLLIVDQFCGTDTANSINEYGWTSQSSAPFGFAFNGIRVRYWF